MKNTKIYYALAMSASLFHCSHAMEKEEDFFSAQILKSSLEENMNGNIISQKNEYVESTNKTFAELIRPVSKGYSGFVNKFIRAFYKTQNIGPQSYIKKDFTENIKKSISFRMIKADYLTAEYQENFSVYFEKQYKIPDSVTLEKIIGKFNNIQEIIDEENARVLTNKNSVEYCKKLSKDMLSSMSFNALLSINTKEGHFGRALVNATIRKILNALKKNKRIFFQKLAEVVTEDNEPKAARIMSFDILKPEYLRNVCDYFWQYIKDQNEITNLDDSIKEEIKRRLADPGNFQNSQNSKTEPKGKEEAEVCLEQILDKADEIQKKENFFEEEVLESKSNQEVFAIFYE